MSKKHDTSKWIFRDGYSHIDYLLENFYYRFLNEKYHVSDTFSDCLEMYVTDHNTVFDCIYRSNDDLFVKEFPMGMRQRCLRTADLFVPSEQRARIDATIHYLRMKGGNWHDVSDIETLIEMTRDHNLVYLMEEELYDISETIQKYRENERTETETLSMKDRFDVCVLTAYIYQRYATRDRLFDYAHINDMTYLKKTDMLLKINDLLNDNYRNYMTSLTKAIYVHIIQQSQDFVDLKTRLKNFRKRN